MGVSFSYSDMDLNPEDYLNGTYQAELVVHAPELFAGSKLMDLATPDEVYRRRITTRTESY